MLGQVMHLQRTAGNRAVGKLLSGVGMTGTTAIQRKLTTEERGDKLRILKDYVRFTPPSEFPMDPYGKEMPNKYQYKAKLIEKIKGSQWIIESLKTKKNMHKDDEDDSWEPKSFNESVLQQAIDEVYPKFPIGDNEEIGREYPEFDKHDCVFAAITHALGFGDDLDTSIEVETRLAAFFQHKKGEVEDSILYRMMEIMGWGLYGVDSFTKLFNPEKEGVMQYPPVGGTFIVSENKDAQGTSGHVFVVEITNDLAMQTYPFPKTLKLYDRQYERQHDKSRTHEPSFTVYAWKVENTSKANELKTILGGG